MKEILEDIIYYTDNNQTIEVETKTFYDAFNELPESVRGNPLAEALQEFALGKGETRITVKQEAERWLKNMGLQYSTNDPFIISIKKPLPIKENGS